jgi:hypothetical protein
MSAQLEGASNVLATAAGELRGAVGALSPALGQLAPQLGALTAEVALLAARADSPELPNAVLDELVRLAEDVERLIASSSEPSDGPRPSLESSQPGIATTVLPTTEAAAAREGES